jgi:RimJ/RimL family protein N-acetyltransferase
VPLLQEFDRRIFAESEYLFPSTSPEKTTDETAALIARFESSPSDALLIMQDTSEAMGVGFVRATPHPVCAHVGAISVGVRRHWRGKGVGRVILDALIAHARSCGRIRRLELTVATENRAAIALYEACGFVHEGRKKGALLVGDRLVDEYLMGMLL